jgi:hypothetical protein
VSTHLRFRLAARFFSAAILLGSAALHAQSLEGQRSGDSVVTQVRRSGDAGGPIVNFDGSVKEVAGLLPHPYHVEARHSKPSCLNTAKCGDLFYSFDGFNMRTSAGTTWQANLMSDTATPPTNVQCNYIALTNTAITPAEADTALSGEIVANGLSRAQATYTNNSTTLSVPSAPTVTVEGSTGSTSLWYWVFACNQGICTTISSSGTTTTSQATASLSSILYNQISWTPVTGASSYITLRTTSSSAPTGTNTNEVGNTAFCTAATCYQNDTGVALVSYIIPSSNLTNFGTYTLVHTWTATGAQSAQAFGVLTAASSGTMCFEGTFTSVSLNTNDTVQLTETVNF